LIISLTGTKSQTESQNTNENQKKYIFFPVNVKQPSGPHWSINPADIGYATKTIVPKK
jgi:hypothetical protein